MNLDHLHWPTEGWGYMHPVDEVLAAYAWIEKTIRPRRLIEFGFHAGHSTTYQLETFPDSAIVTFGVSREVDRGSVNMARNYGGRFTFYKKSTLEIDPYMFLPGSFDFALIDSNHTYKVVANEISLLIRWKVPYMLFDNCETAEVQRAIDEKLPSDAQLIKEFPYLGDWKGVKKNLMMKLYHVPVNSI